MPLDAAATAAGGDHPDARPDGSGDADLAEAFRLLTQRLRAMPRPPRKAVEVVLAVPPEEPPPPRRVRPPPPDPGESVALLLEIIWGAIDLLPQERAMVSDALLLLAPRLNDRQLVALADRLSGMDSPPPLLAAQLILDERLEVSGPLLEKNAHLSDRDMIAAAGADQPEKLRVIARRRSLSPVLSDHLVETGDIAALLQLLRNPGAEFFFSTYMRLCDLAGQHPALQVPITTRPDLPLPVALELFWRLPSDLRRVILTRFLTDSTILNRIIAIVLASEPEETPPEDGGIPAADLDTAVAALAAGRREDAARDFAVLAGIAGETARRIIEDVTGEPLAALLKTLGVSRSRFMEIMAQLTRAGWAPPGQETQDLQAVFDALSGNKARTLLIYWDWFTRRTGPYAPQA
jgi:uncharacterized protein (DUF2336 family)